MIEINQLTKRYGSVLAVDGVSFCVQPGQVTGFLGPNGAGKTTTMRMLLGLNAPTSGTATINGRPFREFGTGLRHVGALLDAGDVHRGRTANAHLAALARSNGLPRRRVEEVLEMVGLGEAGRRRVGSFSLGMRQRLGIATALLGDPPVLLFDEPINGLDPEGIRWARELFRRLAAEGRTVFVSSHLMSEMEHTADHLIVVGDGRLLADEPLADFAARATTAGATVQTPDPAALAEVLRNAGASVLSQGHDTLTVTGLTTARINELAFTHRVLVHEVSAHVGTLEDAFMELTAASVQYRASATPGRSKDR
ncbi:ABC-2 type transport system ATP-binding protein [Streptomyces sp. Ag109_O5-1]|uniref:ABC transporter ATP-binding protein n=1 Tax=Streptomyces sp. Ag109_O5-1 TaxID=1938851 RepID=UPI000FB832A3|nr:ABC transporter ATP-binding protein [Streptomyces sp. Ag109_O5-1]RPE38682.1 ABC-2 type transport system ATP-binding protein [Streptomyces sp. Ag109_O5-1]